MLVKDADTPPPARQVTRFSSPSVTGGWPLDDIPGLETLLLLVREEPLPSDVRLQTLLQGRVPTGKHAPLRAPGEAVIEKLDPDDLTPTKLLSLDRGFKDDAEVDTPFLDLMKHLRNTFRIQRAVRFAHVGK